MTSAFVKKLGEVLTTEQLVDVLSAPNTMLMVRDRPEVGPVMMNLLQPMKPEQQMSVLSAEANAVELVDAGQWSKLYGMMKKWTPDQQVALLAQPYVVFRTIINGGAKDLAELVKGMNSSQKEKIYSADSTKDGLQTYGKELPAVRELARLLGSSPVQPGDSQQFPTAGQAAQPA
jgi:hypothetical protein